MRKTIFLFFISALFTGCVSQANKPVPQPKTTILSVPEITVLFAGDAMQHFPQINSARTADNGYDYKHCFQYIEPYFREADFVIANLETTLSDKNFSGYPRFVSPWQFARDMAYSGIDILVLANNHTCDNGAKGIRNTLFYLDSLQIAHIGIYLDSLQREKIFYIEKRPFKIALLNYTYGTNGIPIPKNTVVNLIDTALIAADINKARQEKATNIIAFLHWGEEYDIHGTAQQEELAEWLHDKGTDIVIGSHPHVIQKAEYTTKAGDTTGITAYSLGNFISNQSYRYTKGGITLSLKLTRKSDTQYGYRYKYMNNFVYTPIENGKKRYYIVPEPIGNAVITENSHSRTFRKFVQDNDAILQCPETKETEILFPDTLSYEPFPDRTFPI